MPFEIGPPLDDIENVLRRRGLSVKSLGNKWDMLLIPDDQIKSIGDVYLHDERWAPYRARKPLSSVCDLWQEHLEKRSFRAVIKTLPELSEPVTIAEFSEILSMNERAIAKYLDVLSLMHCVIVTCDSYQWCGPRVRLSDLIEQHVSWLCSSELRGDAGWGVKLDHLPRAGGDVDVFAWLSPSLLAVELKGKSPSSIKEAELRHFLQRHIELAPDLSLLLVDDLRDITPMIATINSLLSEALTTPKGIHRPVRASDGADLRFDMFPSDDYPGLWVTHTIPVYVSSVREGFLSPIKQALQHYYARWRGFRLAAPPGINFVPHK